WAIDRMKNKLSKIFSQSNSRDFQKNLLHAALEEAEAIKEEDVAMCHSIGRNGSQFLRDGDTWITHCNAGALATAGYGTALGVFRAAKEQKKHFSVFVDETRPLLQGARLTAWELLEEGISATLICDNMAGSLMESGQIQGVVVGADRITSRGFVANKIGTYPLAVLAHYHRIPFYVAAPVSTFDLSISHGSEIRIEERDSSEVTKIKGTTIAPLNIMVKNPSFDVTPPELITAIFTNLGVLKPEFETSIPKMFQDNFSHP
ncbi:S-methyl-5-thioribose-1-phosphate isomerase, partial [bacterium]|nr:S-methyl-5-thioribose-1-phosphate isomerase [bacterium]